MNVQKISRWIDRAIELIGGISVLLIILCTSINIALRWTVGRSIGELDEIALMAFVWSIYVGMGLLNNHNEHICMDFIIIHLPKPARVALTLINYLLEAGISTVITVLAVQLMLKSWTRTLNVTHIPYSFLHLVIAIGFALMIVSVLAKTVGLIGALVRGDDPFAEEVTQP